MAADGSIPVSQTIPGTITVTASGATHINAFTLQSDGDCYIQFFKGDGTTELSGKIHLKSYKVLSNTCASSALMHSSAGVKIVVSGNVSGSINGFVSYYA
jgi:hypothetical protein